MARVTTPWERSGDEETPRLELSFDVHWCPRHLEPLRERWPATAAIGMRLLAEAAVRDDRIIQAAPLDSEGTRDAFALPAVLREFSPLCCLLGDERMREIYAEIEEALDA